MLEHSLGTIDNFDAAHFQNITDMFTDQYWYCTQAFTDMMVQQGATVYNYLFTYKGQYILKLQDINHYIRRIRITGRLWSRLSAVRSVSCRRTVSVLEPAVLQESAFE